MDNRDINADDFRRTGDYGGQSDSSHPNIADDRGPGIKQVPLDMIQPVPTDIKIGAEQTSLSRGSAFALVSKGLTGLRKGLFELGKLGVRGIALGIGLPLFGVGYVAGGAVLLTSTLVKSVGRLTIGGLGYAFGAAADLITGTTTKAGAVSKIFSHPTDAAAKIIQLAYVPAAVAWFLGTCCAVVGLNASQLNTLLEKTQPIAKAFQELCKTCDEGIESVLHKKTNVNIEHIQLKETGVNIEHIPLVEAGENTEDIIETEDIPLLEEVPEEEKPLVFQPVESTAYEADPLSHFSEEYLNLRPLLLDCWNNLYKGIAKWELSPDGGMIGDFSLNPENSLTPSHGISKLTDPFEIIKPLNRQRAALGVAPITQDLFAPEYRKQQQAAANYLNALKHPGKKRFNWKVEPNGGLCFGRSWPQDQTVGSKNQRAGSKEERENIVNKMKQYIETTAGMRLTSLKLDYGRWSKSFKGSITDRMEIQKLAQLNET